jgi:A/G-specific adenine glycosylase
MRKALTQDPLLGLARWFERQKRVLPWRDDPSFYRVWVSEIMLQQTQVVAVVPYFERFLKRFPDLESLAHAPESAVLEAWAGLGYYSRARNIHRGAQRIASQGWPANREEWEAIPGVGPYTAGAILSIAGNRCEAILDGNVERVLSRFFRIQRRTDSAYKKRLWDESRKWVTQAHQKKIHPRVTNQALMELGALVCTPKSPKCEVCPIQGACSAYQNRQGHRFPPPKPKKQWIELKETADAVFCQGKVWLIQDPEARWRKGLWDFPIRKDAKRSLKVRATAQRSNPNQLAIEIHYVVTRHRVTRKIVLQRLPKSALKKGFCLDPNFKGPGKWFALGDTLPALGAPATKALKKIREQFPELWRDS